MINLVIILGFIAIILYIIASLINYKKLINELNSVDEWANTKD